MELYDRFNWSNQHLNLRHFVDLYGHVLPQVVLVTEGYAGRDDEMHQIGADEIYWVLGVQSQTRILLKDCHRRCNSVPLDSTSSFQVMKKDGSTSEQLPLQEALRRCSNKSDRLRFSEDEDVKICTGAESVHVEQLGWMEVVDQYDQKYLLAHSMGLDEVMPQRIAMPFYVPISVEVAVGLSKRSHQAFQKFRDDMIKIVATFRSKVKLETGILQFSSLPEGDYTYTTPCFEANKAPATEAELGRKSDSDDDDDDDGEGYEEMTDFMLPPRNALSVTTKSFTTPNPESFIQSVGQSSGKLKEPKLAAPKPSTDTPQPVVATVAPLAPTHQKDDSNALLSEPGVIDKPKSRQTWKSASEIPPYIEDFSVEEVHRAMKVLGLDDIAFAFEGQEIDGKLLISLDKDILVSEFKCSKFQARKIEKFIEGWRPKT